jgi:hypothetical protein
MMPDSQAMPTISTRAKDSNLVSLHMAFGLRVVRHFFLSFYTLQVRQLCYTLQLALHKSDTCSRYIDAGDRTAAAHAGRCAATLLLMRLRNQHVVAPAGPAWQWTIAHAANATAWQPLLVGPGF